MGRVCHLTRNQIARILDIANDPDTRITLQYMVDACEREFGIKYTKQGMRLLLLRNGVGRSYKHDRMPFHVSAPIAEPTSDRVEKKESLIKPKNESFEDLQIRLSEERHRKAKPLFSDETMKIIEEMNSKGAI